MWRLTPTPRTSLARAACGCQARMAGATQGHPLAGMAAATAVAIGGGESSGLLPVLHCACACLPACSGASIPHARDGAAARSAAPPDPQFHCVAGCQEGGCLAWRQLPPTGMGAASAARWRFVPAPSHLGAGVLWKPQPRDCIQPRAAHLSEGELLQPRNRTGRAGLGGPRHLRALA